MINFYKMYNKTGLDKEEYGPLIEMLYINEYWDILKPIEHIIKSSPRHAYRYAMYVMWGRWIEAEQYIMKDPRSAANYATDVMKERWLEAEPIIKDSYWWDDYCYAFDIE